MFWFYSGCLYVGWNVEQSPDGCRNVSPGRSVRRYDRFSSGRLSLWYGKPVRLLTGSWSHVVSLLCRIPAIRAPIRNSRVGLFVGHGVERVTGVSENLEGRSRDGLPGVFERLAHLGGERTKVHSSIQNVRPLLELSVVLVWIKTRETVGTRADVVPPWDLVRELVPRAGKRVVAVLGRRGSPTENFSPKQSKTIICKKLFEKFYRHPNVINFSNS